MLRVRRSKNSKKPRNTADENLFFTDILVVCGQENVLPSSTNPTRPYCVNTLDEHLDVSLADID